MLKQSQFGHRNSLGTCHHKMVKHTHIDQGRGGLECLRQRLIGARGLGRAAWVVVRQHHAGRVERQRPQHHLARIDAGLRERAAKQLLQHNQPVLAVQKQHREYLVGSAAELQLQVVAHRLRCGKQRFFLQFFCQRAARQLQHGDQLGALGRAQPLDGLERVGSGMQQPGDAAEIFQQLLAQLQRIFAGQAGAQQQRQQLGIAERAGAAGQQFFARTDVGGEVFHQHGQAIAGGWVQGQGVFSTIGAVYKHLPAARAGSESLRLPMQTSTRVDPPVIQQGSFLTLHYRMAGPDGANIINTFDSQPATLSLGSGQLSPAIEQRLLGLPEGARTTFELAAGEAFGERNPALLQWVARKLLDELNDSDDPYKVGDVVQFPTPNGMGQYAGTVQQVKGNDEAVQFDFNHPLAGQAVVFEVQVIGIL